MRPGMHRPPHILPLLVLAQFLGTINWLVGNAVLPGLQRQWGLTSDAVAALTNSVQFGFIAGTLIFALIALADRLSPRILFFICALLGGATSMLIASREMDFDTLLALRFFTGMMLAGIYPVGMKLAASWYPQGLGRALGYLIGALVLGTASSHLIAGLIGTQWQWAMSTAGGASLLAGLLVLVAVPEGPARYRGAPLRWHALVPALRHAPLRRAAGGYFGHMWELYAVWALAPIWLSAWSRLHGESINVSLWTFSIIAAGTLGSVLGGLLSARYGSIPVARGLLTLSGLCCLLSPLMMVLPLWLVLPFWLVWGFAVVGDSPQLSTLSARNAPPEVIGSALTLINCLGYSLSALAVELLSALLTTLPVEWLFWLLIPGPLLGLVSLGRLPPETVNPPLASASAASS